MVDQMQESIMNTSLLQSQGFLPPQRDSDIIGQLQEKLIEAEKLQRDWEQKYKQLSEKYKQLNNALKGITKDKSK